MKRVLGGQAGCVAYTQVPRISVLALLKFKNISHHICLFLFFFFQSESSSFLKKNN